MAESLSNFKPFEGTLNGDITLEFSWRPRAVTIINTGNGDLKFKFNAGEDYGTLAPGQLVSPEIIIRNVYLRSSTSTSYKVWGVG